MSRAHLVPLAFAAAVMATWGLGCRCRSDGRERERCAGPDPRSQPVSPYLSGRAMFIQRKDKPKAGKIQLFGTCTTTLWPGESAGVDEVEVFGAPGWVDPATAIAKPCLDKFQPEHSAWRRSIQFDWDDCKQYTVIARYQVWHKVGDEIVRYHLDLPALFKGIKQSDVVEPPLHLKHIKEDGTTTEAEAGSANSTSHAAGTFSANNSLAMYDVEVDYTKRLKSIEIYAAPGSTSPFPGPAGDDTYYIGGERNAANFHLPPWTWTAHLENTYDGSDSYKVLIRVTYWNSTLGVDEWTGVFNDLQSHQGTVIQLD